MKKREYAYIFDNEGNFLGSIAGEYDRIIFNDDLIGKMAGNIVTQSYQRIFFLYRRRDSYVTKRSKRI